MPSNEKMKTYINNLKITRIGIFFYYFIPFRRDIVLANLNFVFENQLTQDEIKKLAKGFYSHLIRFIYENIRSLFYNNDTFRKKVILKGEENLLDAAKEGKGVFLLTGHLGNWELSAIGAILNTKLPREKMHILRSPLRSKKIEKILLSRFFNVGWTVIFSQNAFRKILPLLKKNNVIVFTFDQHVSLRGKDGIAVSFFDKPAGTYRSLAMITKATGAKVVPMRMYRQDDGKHIVEFSPALSWIENSSEEEAIRINTQIYNTAIEEFIKDHPEQWLWIHKRWKINVADKKRYSAQLTRNIKP